MAAQECANAGLDCGNTVESHKSPVPSSFKRPRGSPTQCTPHREEKRVSLRELVANSSHEIPRVTLFNRLSTNTAPDNGSTNTQMEKWTEEELQALTEFVLFHTTGDKWPAHKQPDFWRAASDFMKQRLGPVVSSRSASACRSRVVRFLSKRFRMPTEAGTYFNDKLPSQACASSSSCSTKSCGVQTDPIDSSLLLDILNMVPIDSQLPLLSEVFSAYLLTVFKLSVPNDFLHLAASAMLQLANNGRTNVLYNLAKGIGTLRQDEEDTRFPVKRMPMGLVEYTAQFFASDNLQQVTCPMDYRQWLQTMYCNFGEKWAKLHRGPMWCATRVEQDYQGTSGPVVCKQRTMEALVNVPAISERSIRSDIATCKTTLDSQIQLNVLDEAVRHNPNAWWWIKADGCDINKGLKESSRLEWSGDVDLADGSLLEKYKAYRKQLETAENIGLHGNNVVQELANVLDTINKDLDFLQSQIIKFNNAYSEKLQSHVQKERDLITLSWKVKELTELDQNGRQLHRDTSSLINKLEEHAEDNIPSQLCSFRHKLVSFIKGVSRHQRTPATHILVFMISAEDRRRKPYALPIQCIPYVGLSDAKIRELANKIITEMVKRKMNIAGFTTDGEWNSLRAKGNTRPLSIFQIRADSRAKFSHMGLKRMVEMFTVVRNKEGNISAALHNPAISGELLGEIDSWYTQGATIDDVIERLRLRTVPPGYTIHSWIEGKDETKAEKLRSILAQLEYKHQIDTFNMKGIPFINHVYVPEIHPLTQTGFCEREDEGHVLKRIGQSLRHGGPHNIHLERFEEALHDTAAGLTYPALSGIRKQSVEDVERLFSPSLVLWMENKGYHHEAEYLKHVRNWRRASDERGLTDDQRSEFNAGLLNYILDDLMPWHKEDGLRDFSLLEVNRSIRGVRGFSRETLVALVANIESREWRRKFNSEHSIPPEHPRASTTDDVECFFSVLRDCVGKDFTLKEVFYGWRKVTEEFMKRMDPELPFYYHTSKHSRYYEGVMPEFSVQPAKSKPKKLPRYELLGENNRITFSVRGDSSIRAQFHNTPVDLPPLPGTHNPCTHEHSYAMTHN